MKTSRKIEARILRAALLAAVLAACMGARSQSANFVVDAADPKVAVQMAEAFDLAQKQRVMIDDSATGWSVGASFLAKTTSTPLTFTATAISGGALTALEAILDPGQLILGAWQFSASDGYTPGDPAYLSFGVGSGHDRNGLPAWHYDGTNWSPYTANDLTYNGTCASFTVTSFSGYAVAVPEPGTLALLLAAALGVLGYAWWRCTVTMCRI